MKQVVFSFIVLIFLGSCRHITGSGNIVTEKRSTGSFTGVSAGQSFDVEVQLGATTEVMVESDDNIIKYIETEVSDGILKIRLKSGHSFNNAHLKVYVTSPEITSIKTSSSAEIVVKNLLTSDKKLSFNASSSSSILAEVEAPEVVATASSSATIELMGKTKVYTASVSSSADLKSGGLLSESTTVTAKSSATASVHASVNLVAKASSSADITYRGAANVQKSVSSSGSVEKKE